MYTDGDKKEQGNDPGNSNDETLCPNQLMDRNVQKIWEDQIDYYADNESEKDNEKSNEKVHSIHTLNIE